MGAIAFGIVFGLILLVIYIFKAATPFKCIECEEESNMNHRKDLHCPVCNNKSEICSSCLLKTESRVVSELIWCCQSCYNKYSSAAKEFIVVKSSHIGKHKILDQSDKLLKSTEYKDRQKAVEELKYYGVKNGYNGLINLRFQRISYEEDNGYIQNFTQAQGNLVHIIKT